MSAGEGGWFRCSMDSMGKHVIHISEAEVAKDFAAVMSKVRAGAEVVIEKDARPAAVVKAPEPVLRMLSESLRLARERGSTATLDEGFGKDVEEFIESHREPLDSPEWD
jgi:antitoxin (DNA-binding transcriptional repressor) of toxin-antitoxin stability system